MTGKTKYTVPFLALTLLVPVMVFAQNSTDVIYDPVVTQYVEKIISQEGKSTEKKIIDGQKVSITTKTKELQDNKYKVKSVTHVNGEKISSEIFHITINNDTFRLENKKHGIDQTFFNSTNVISGQGSGSSSTSGARIGLHDREYGTPTLTLDDNYSACSTLNQAVFQAPIRPNTVDVTWDASPYYLHWCFVPHEFDHGQIKYGTNKVSLEGHGDRRGSHVFTNYDVGTTWYDVRITFVYGDW